VIAPVLPTYARAPVAFEKGEGPWLFDEAGEQYLDFAAGIAVCALGHAHPKLVAALEGQARRLWHTSNLYGIPGQQELARRLVAASFADTVFFTNSGLEAMECALKMARKFHSHNGNPERYRTITFEGSFHGRSFATIAAAGQPKLVDGFGPMMDGFDILPFGDHDALKAAITDETAAILIEPVQGEGGIRPVPYQCLRGLRELCDEHGILLIMDEIQCGMGRTGKLFAHEWAGDAAPDILASAKGIGGGFPMGACLATERAAAGMVAGTHGSTYGGNPLAMAVGNAVMEEMTAPGFMDHVIEMAGLLRQRLAGLADAFPDIIEDVRGEGLMMGIKLRGDGMNIALVNAARERRLLVVPAGDNVVRILPPLIIEAEHVSRAVDTLADTCASLRDAASVAAK